METAVANVVDAALAADLAGAALTLARRFAAGGTMWCISPAWQPHAQHIAVEFVHPVIVGKRALPAVALTGPNLVDVARVSVRPGDVVIAVADCADPEVLSIMRRTSAWGATSVWIGNGVRPTPGAADHVLWLDDPDPRTPATGGFVLLYHVLWELTHVCFEHPGLLSVDDCTEETCVVCSDEGRLAEVMTVPDQCTARVRTAAGPESVETSLVGPVDAGDLLLVHAGMAISRIDETRG